MLSSRAAFALCALGACRTAAPAIDAAPSAVPSASVAASAERPSEPPLAWGTRPPREGPLYPVVDGCDVASAVWPVGESAFFTFSERSVVRLDDDGAVPLPPQDDFTPPVATEVFGTWPSSVVFFGRQEGDGRHTSEEPLWYRGDRWKTLASFKEKGNPSFSRPVRFRDWIVASRQERDNDAGVVVAFPTEKAAPPIAGLADLSPRPFRAISLAASDTTLYALGVRRTAKGWADAVRALADGKATETPLNDGLLKPIGTTSRALYLASETRLVRVEDGKATDVPFGADASDVKILASAVAKNGDVWLLTSKLAVVVLHGTSITELPLPRSAADASPAGDDWPGRRLAGVEDGDVYAIGAGSALFHLVGETWQEVSMPRTPFGTAGRFRADAVWRPARGDVYVKASYLEKGIGWRDAEWVGAVLRTKRPKEVKRCNLDGSRRDQDASGVMSFPPHADESCTTPFVVLAPIALKVTTAKPNWLFDKGTDYPTVREAIKGAPALGSTVELVEVVSGDQRYLGAKVASLAVGRELARIVGEKVKLPKAYPVRPEIVCGTPKEERVLQIDVATGAITP